uniref:Zinc finger CCCH domain-containing protein 36 n=1 Tax=Solanum tuberosum TaxID=4113 RepID=M0ZQH7_SOLTU
MIGYPKSILYDGIRDSIDQRNVADGSFSVLTKHMQANADPASTETNKVETFCHSDILPEKDLPSDDTEVAHHANMNTSSKEDKHLESERFTSGNEIDIDNKCVNTESTVLKNFHAALVEFVKELLRPTWNEGLISKDAYKKVVKKTVDKVENSLHPNKIRNTAESTKDYFDLSLPKHTNTIEAYVEKYGNIK